MVSTYSKIEENPENHVSMCPFLYERLNSSLFPSSVIRWEQKENHKLRETGVTSLQAMPCLDQ